jgi:hypothetical protein
VILRQVLAASPLREYLPPGEAAEVATRDAAALWGLPDFVYKAEIYQVGSGSREVGDGLLLVGGLGIVLQIKSRVAITFDDVKESAWLAKQTRTAIRQANGTIRSLSRYSVRVTNGRGRTIEINGSEYRWLTVVVVDHPSVPRGITPSLAESQYPAVVLLRRDWEFLFDQLKSTHAVGGYFQRVAGKPLELGNEPARYFELALADQQAKPAPLDPALPTGGRRISSSLLPMEAAATDDVRAHLLIRSIFEDIAITPTDDVQEDQRVRVLAELDRLPVSDRGLIGRFLMNGLDSIPKADPTTFEWRLRRIAGRLDSDRLLHLSFGTCSKRIELSQEMFSTWVQLRHHQIQQHISHNDILATVGVLLTPRDDGQRVFDTTMVAIRGDLGLTDEEVATYERIWSGYE